MQLYIALVFLACLHHVRSNPHCIGTCYSGTLFPEPQDVFHGKHLKGYSYNNITTDDPVKCYSSCVQDCRCKACQMKDERCELLDEDKASKADSFTAESGYVYFDLKQTMYKGSHSNVLPQGGCYNGCCRSKPCMNGGTCEEQCSSPKEKFTCICQKTYKGRTCEERVKSCLDISIASKTTPENGVYWIKRDDIHTIPVYCVFDGNRLWTLIESFSREQTGFWNKPFSVDYRINKNIPPNWDNYRMSKNSTKYLRTKSTLFRATCNFPIRVSLTPDLLIGRLSDVDIIQDTDIKGCRKYEFIDVMGHNCTNCSEFTAQGHSRFWHFHLDISGNKCSSGLGIKSPQDINHNTDLFGYYKTYDERFTCTRTDKDTTQWWLGQEK